MSAASASEFTSSIENAIINSIEPIDLNEAEVISANGERGIWANKTEVADWVGPIPITDYPINQDPNPVVVTKKPKCIECKQQVLVKYLEPPALPQPGEIIINQDQNILAPPAPPLVIRQIPNIPEEPEPLVLREAPPAPPEPPIEKVITIPGRLLSPPPRKVVIEKLPELPAKPQDIILERWLPYKDVNRKIILNPKPADPIQIKPKNVIVEWEKINCGNVNTEIRHLGVEKADPLVYAQTYGPSLKTTNQLPPIADEVKQVDGVALAAENNAKYFMGLEGDIHALGLIDLDKEGLSEYKQYLDHLQNGFPSQSRGETQCNNVTTSNMNQNQSNQSYEAHASANFEQAPEQNYQPISKQPTILQPGNLPPSFFQNSQLQMPMQMQNSQFQFPSMQQAQFQAPSMMKQNLLPQANFQNMNMNQGLSAGFNQSYNFPNMNQMPKNFGMNKPNFFNNGFYGF